jgi:hypothetical protein
MGLLRDIRKGQEQPGGWASGGAVVFWAIVGAGCGIGLATFLNLPEGVKTFAVCAAGLGGLCVGFYAGFGTTALARVLALPGTVLELLL